MWMNFLQGWFTPKIHAIDHIQLFYDDEQADQSVQPLTLNSAIMTAKLKIEANHSLRHYFECAQPWAAERSRAWLDGVN